VIRLDRSLITVLISAIVGPILALVVTHCLASVRAAKERAAVQPKRFRVLQFVDPTVAIRPWNMRRVKWLLAIPSVLFCALFLVTAEPNAFTTLFVVGTTVYTVGVTFFLRSKPPSRTVKTAEFKVKGNLEYVLQDCLTAVQQIGARIGNYDSLKGVIEARTKMNWINFGQIIKIEVAKTSRDEMSLRITSDAVQPSATIDFGANARNIRRIKNRLLR